MSKKETEYDRYDRMRKIERESEMQKRKDVDSSGDLDVKKKGKSKSDVTPSRKNWSKDYELVLEEGHELV